MRQKISDLLKFIRDEHGATAIEYGLIAALVSLVMYAGLGAAFDSISRLFGEVNKVSTQIQENAKNREQ